MSAAAYTNEEIARRGEALYEQAIREKVEEGNRGSFLVVDIETGEYEVDKDDMKATERALARRPDPVLYITRIGHVAATRLGSRFRVSGPGRPAL